MPEKRSAKTGWALAGLGAFGAAAWAAGRWAVHEKVLKFHHDFACPLPPQRLWAELETAFRDSRKSPIWPNELETIRSPGLGEGQLVVVAYKLPGGRVSPVTYWISGFKKGKTFAYSTLKGHPLKGGAVVEVRKERAGSRLIWSGEYRYSGFSAAALYMKLYFERKFFKTLEHRLAALS